MTEDVSRLLNRAIAIDEPPAEGLDRSANESLWTMFFDAGLMSDGGLPPSPDAAANPAETVLESILGLVASRSDAPPTRDAEPDLKRDPIDDAFALRLSAAYRSGALDLRLSGPAVSLGLASRSAKPPVQHGEVPIPAALRRPHLTAQDGGRRRYVPPASIGRPLYTPW